MSMVTFSHVVKRFGPHTVLDDISLTIEKGEVVVVVGPSGSGKSTFLRCINALESIQGGDIRVGNLSVNGTPAQVRELRREAGMVFQQFNLFPQLTALQNVMFGPIQTRGASKSQARELAMQLLAKVGLSERANHYPSELSGGQQQRVAIARALVHEPRLVLADEPTANLDRATGRAIVELMRAMQRRTGATFVFSSHDPALIDEADVVVRLVDGRLDDSSTMFQGSRP